MPNFDVAHINRGGNDIIIIPLNNSFDSKTTSDKNDIIEELQIRANSAGLRGTVVPVWSNFNRMKFIAPIPWHTFFRSIDLNYVRSQINRQISW